MPARDGPASATVDADADADAFWRSLVDSASAGYGGADLHAHRFARAKLGGDRVFRHIVESGLIAPGAAVVDVGCGQGLLARLLHVAGAAALAGRWPAAWAPAPTGAHVTGVDPLPLDLDRARKALGDAATFVRADMRGFVFPPCDTAVFFDTLHYIAAAEQDQVLGQVRSALRPGGTVLMRVHDAASGWRFRLGQWIDQGTALLHGAGWMPVAGRSLAGWTTSLESLGFSVRALQMNGRPPFANLLIVGRLPG